MKIYKRAEFLKLPEGILFRKGQPCYFENLQVKASTIENDFICMEIGDFEAFDSGDFGNKFEQMLNGESIQMTDDCYGRDGCFDDEDIFLVFETEDLHKLKSIVEEAIEAEKVKESTAMSETQDALPEFIQVGDFVKFVETESPPVPSDLDDNITITMDSKGRMIMKLK